MAYPAMTARGLATVADRVPAHRAAVNVMRAGPFATSPTALAAAVTVVFPAHRTGGHPTRSAQNILASVALFQAVVAGDVAVAVEGDLGRFLAAGVAEGTA